MAAGLGFKTFTSGEVLTAADTNGYLMQGVNVFADAAARTAAIASPQEGQMSFLKDTNSTEYYSGSAWVAVGAAGGGMTVITSGTLSGAAVNLTSIPSTYNDLYLVLTNATTSATNKAIYLRFNNISTANTYYAQNGTVQAFDATFGDTEFTIGAYGTGTSNSLIFTYIPSYANSTTRKLAYGQEFRNGATTNTDIVWRWRLGLHSPTTAISEINILPESGTFSSGSYTLYGVK